MKQFDAGETFCTWEEVASNTFYKCKTRGWLLWTTLPCAKLKNPAESGENVFCVLLFFLFSSYCDIHIVASAAAAVAVYCFAEASRCLPQIIAASFFSLCGHLIGPVPLDGWCSRWIHEISDIKPSSCLAKILIQENKDFSSFVFVKCTCDALLLSSVSTGTSGDESVSSSYKQTAHTV